MNVLAIDTATDALDAAVCGAGRLLARRTYNEGQAHAERLMPFVDEVVRTAGWSRVAAGAPTAWGLKEAIAVCNGPGSYTGLRIGVATAKALAFALRVPVYGVPTLAAIAASAHDEGGLDPDGYVAPVLDARRGDVYAAIYPAANLARPGAGGLPLPLLEPAVLPLPAFSERLHVIAGHAALRLCGDAAAERAATVVGSRTGARLEVRRIAGAAPAAGRLAMAMIAAGAADGDPMRLEIAYLRAAHVHGGSTNG